MCRDYWSNWWLGIVEAIVCLGLMRVTNVCGDDKAIWGWGMLRQ